MGSYIWFSFKIPTWVPSKLKLYINATCFLWFRCWCIHLTRDIMLLGVHRSVINWPKPRCGALALKIWFLFCKDLFEKFLKLWRWTKHLGIYHTSCRLNKSTTCLSCSFCWALEVFIFFLILRVLAIFYQLNDHIYIYIYLLVELVGIRLFLFSC